MNYFYHIIIFTLFLINIAYAESTFSDLKKIPLKDVTEEFEHYLCTAKYNGYDLHLKIVNDEIV